MDLQPALTSMPRSVLYAVVPFFVLAVALSFVRLYTTLTYHRDVARFQDETSNPEKRILESPQIPYTIPWLGNSLQFLGTQPGLFWQKLFSWHPRSTGVCTLLLGGTKTHILFNPTIVQAMFKNRVMSRAAFEHELYQRVFRFSHEQLESAEAGPCILPRRT